MVCTATGTLAVAVLDALVDTWRGFKQLLGSFWDRCTVFGGASLVVAAGSLFLSTCACASFPVLRSLVTGGLMDAAFRTFVLHPCSKEKFASESLCGLAEGHAESLVAQMLTWGVWGTALVASGWYPILAYSIAQATGSVVTNLFEQFAQGKPRSPAKYVMDIILSLGFGSCGGLVDIRCHGNIANGLSKYYLLADEVSELLSHVACGGSAKKLRFVVEKLIEWLDHFRSTNRPSAHARLLD